MRYGLVLGVKSRGSEMAFRSITLRAEIALGPVLLIPHLSEAEVTIRMPDLLDGRRVEIRQNLPTIKVENTWYDPAIPEYLEVPEWPHTDRPHRAGWRQHRLTDASPIVKPSGHQQVAAVCVELRLPVLHKHSSLVVGHQ